MSIIHFPEIVLPNSHPVDSLPFVGRRSDGKMRDFWHIQPSGDYAQECLQGNFYAEEFLKYIAKHRDAHLLGPIVRDITRHQLNTGIEIGFMIRISKPFLNRIRMRFKHDLSIGSYPAL